MCPPVPKIIHSLKLVDYLHVQADNPWYNYYITGETLDPNYCSRKISVNLHRKRWQLSCHIFCVFFTKITTMLLTNPSNHLRNLITAIIVKFQIRQPISGPQIRCFSYFSTKTYVVGTQKNRLNETVLLSTQHMF